PTGRILLYLPRGEGQDGAKNKYHNSINLSSLRDIISFKPRRSGIIIDYVILLGLHAQKCGRTTIDWHLSGVMVLLLVAVRLKYIH
ncbi:MAG TPA: hypothetical protein PLW09_15200, partial [Candidatus Kapabacteria bacterium]|nr:hypothetical protein [Candidatus Kapabacteria bacterium]